MHIREISQFCALADTGRDRKQNGSYLILDRILPGEHGHQGEQRPANAGHHRHVIARGRQHVADTEMCMASFTGAEMASRLPVISADAIAPLSPGNTARMRLSMASRMPSMTMA